MYNHEVNSEINESYIPTGRKWRRVLPSDLLTACGVRGCGAGESLPPLRATTTSAIHHRVTCVQLQAAALLYSSFSAHTAMINLSVEIKLIAFDLYALILQLFLRAFSCYTSAEHCFEINKKVCFLELSNRIVNNLVIYNFILLRMPISLALLVAADKCSSIQVSFSSLNFEASFHTFPFYQIYFKLSLFL